MELSVTHTEGLPEGDLWAHGDEHAAKPDRPIYGRADFVASTVALVKLNTTHLRLEMSEPPPRHANVLGWPPPDETDLRKLLAMELRAKANPTILRRTAP